MTFLILSIAALFAHQPSPAVLPEKIPLLVAPKDRFKRRWPLK